MLTTVGTVILSIVLATSASSGGGTAGTDDTRRTGTGPGTGPGTGRGTTGTGDSGTGSDDEAISESISIEPHNVNHVMTINESNWSDMLYGEWLVKL